MKDKKLQFETIQIHGGYHVDASQSRGIAIHPTAKISLPHVNMPPTYLH